MRLEHLDLEAVLEQVGREKNIDKAVLISALEDAMLSAARKKLGVEADLEARYNEEVGEVEVYEFLRIVQDGEKSNTSEIEFTQAKKLDPELTQDAIGEDLGVKLESKEFGRIAAQNAKQIIVQRVREAERLMVFNEYKDRKGEIVTGTVRRFERGDVIVDLGRAEAVLPTSEQVSKENIRIQDRLVAYVVDVLEAARGAQIILSRTHPNLVVKLFEQEVPEISEGIVTIESASREAGFRSKISVRSKDLDVDPVGACVGMKGTRVQAVVQELRGEKIDIVPYEGDEARFVCNALAPAEVTRVLVNEEEHSMHIVVPDDQLSLAIGRRGQNVRLASQLTGWKIDIQSESKATSEKEDAWIALSKIKLSDLQFQTLFNHGVRNIKDFLTMDDELLASLPGFESADLQQVKALAEEVLKLEETKEERKKEEVKKEAKELFILDEVFENLKAQDNLDAISLDKIESEAKEKLESFGYLDLMDVYLDANLQKLVDIVQLEEPSARIVLDSAKKTIASLDERLSVGNEE